LSAAELEFEELVDAAASDSRVIGLVLGGSRGKDPSYVTAESDYDVYVVVSDEHARDEWAEQFPSRHGEPVEVVVATLDAYRLHALPGSGTEWNAYTFAHVTPLIDRLDGEIARITRSKAEREPDTAAPPLLDGFINFYYRARKNHRDGLVTEAHLDAAESVPWFLDFLFAAFGRVRPYNKWLPWDLHTHPLPEPWSADEVLGSLQAVLRDRNLEVERSLFLRVECLARDRGWDETIDGWEPDLEWLRSKIS
jgi:hypothetical protein